MRCDECFWCTANTAIGSEFVCCSEKSEHYNKIMTKEEKSKTGCEFGETRQAVDYRTMNPWQFASKYYM